MEVGEVAFEGVVVEAVVVEEEVVAFAEADVVVAVEEVVSTDTRLKISDVRAKFSHFAKLYQGNVPF